MSHKKLIKNTIFYSIAIGLNKGSLLLFLPILAAFFSVETFGLYMLVHTSSSIIAPIVTLNGQAAIIREGAEDIEQGKKLFTFYTGIAFALGLILSLLLLLFDFTNGKIILLSTILGTANAMIDLLLSWFRLKDDFIRFFVVSLGRVFFVLVVLLLSIYKFWDLSIIISVQALLILILGFAFGFFVWNGNDLKTIFVEYKKYKECMTYAAWLIPHNLSQWVMNNSDKVVVNMLFGAKQLGVYSFGYTVGSVIILINSGISFSLPQHIIKNIKQWSDGRIKTKAIILYAVVTIVLYICLLIALEIIKNYYHLSYFDNKNMNGIIFFVFLGFFVMGIYYFYGNYLFYVKKSKILSGITIFCSLLNIILTVALCLAMGVIGAAISTFISFFVYTLITIYYTNKHFSSIQKTIFKDIVVVILSAIILYLCYWLFDSCY